MSLRPKSPGLERLLDELERPPVLLRLAPPFARPPPSLRTTVALKRDDGQPPVVVEASPSSSLHQPVEDADAVFAQVGADTDAEMGAWDWQDEAPPELDQSAAIASERGARVCSLERERRGSSRSGRAWWWVGESRRRNPKHNQFALPHDAAADTLDSVPTSTGEPSLASPSAAMPGDGGTADARASSINLVGKLEAPARAARV